MSLSIVYGEIPSEELSAEPRECAARLGMPPGEKPEVYDECLAQLKKAAKCRYAAVRCPVSYSGDAGITSAFGTVESRDLRKNLRHCGEIFVFAVTLGLEVDRLIHRYSLTSGVKYFTADAVASALCEGACDAAELQIRGAVPCRVRFSPGYGDLSLGVQPAILSLLEAKRLLVITLDSSLLMTPRKSVTAVMGII